MAQNILNACHGVQDSAAIDGLAEAEFTADRDLAFRLGLVGEQAGRHLAGVDQHEGRIEECGNPADLGELLRIGNGVEGCAQGEAALPAAGVHVNHHPHPRKDM